MNHPSHGEVGGLFASLRAALQPDRLLSFLPTLSSKNQLDSYQNNDIVNLLPTSTYTENTNVSNTIYNREDVDTDMNFSTNSHHKTSGQLLQDNEVQDASLLSTNLSREDGGDWTDSTFHVGGDEEEDTTWRDVGLEDDGESQILENGVSTAEFDYGYIFQHITLYVGISGAYDLERLSSHLHRRGLDSSILSWICNGKLAQFSPTQLILNYVNQSQVMEDRKTYTE
eukprot:gene11919-15191_t